jgi:hypothetical protein
MNRASADQIADHERDHRKHEWRPGDPLPFRFETPIAGALEVALLVKAVKDPRDGAKLIEQYARTAAAEARLQAVIDTGDRIVAAIEAPLSRKEPV